VAKSEGRFEEAIGYFNDAFELWPDLFAEFQSAYGDTYADWAMALAANDTIDDLKEALEKLDAAIAANPDGIAGYNDKKVDVYSALGGLYLSAKEYEKAVDAYTDAYDLSGDNDYIAERGKVYAAWAADLFESGNYEAAIEKYAAAAEDDPSNAATYAKAQAECYFELAEGTTDLNQKIHYLEQAYDLDDSYAWPLSQAYLTRGENRYLAGEYASAEEDVEEGLRLAGDNETPEMYSLLANIKFQLFKWEEAIQHLKTAVNWPGTTPKEEDLELLVLCLMDSYAFDEALEYASLLAELFPSLTRYANLSQLHVR